MTERAQESYQLLRQFREFYVELSRLRHYVKFAREKGQVALSALPDDSAVEPGDEAVAPEENEAVGTMVVTAPPVDRVTQQVWGEMGRFLDQKMYRVNTAVSSLSHDILKELVYIMAAFADETFVCMLEWDGRDYWRDHLMELRFFRSQIAGQSLFHRIDNLVMRSDYGTEELMAVYLMVLSLGFKGRYQMEPGVVEAYRKKLFDRLHLSDFPYLSHGYRMFPDAYQHTVTEGSPVRLAEPRKWWSGVALVIAVWLVVSTAAWMVLTHPLRTDLHVTRQLLSAVQTEFRKEGARTATTYPFSKPNGRYEVTLPKNLPEIEKTEGASVAPFFVRVQVVGRLSPGLVQDWLSKGKIEVTATEQCSAQQQDILFAESVPAPRGVSVTPDLYYFLLDPKLTSAEAQCGTKLEMPEDAPAKVHALSLYLPAQNAGVTQ